MYKHIKKVCVRTPLCVIIIYPRNYERIRFPVREHCIFFLTFKDTVILSLMLLSTSGDARLEND